MMMNILMIWEEIGSIHRFKLWITSIDSRMQMALNHRSRVQVPGDPPKTTALL